MDTKNPLQAYKQTQIKTANQGRLIVMLYDGAIRSINIALESFEKDAKKLDDISSSIMKAQDIITELMVSLDFDRGGEIAKNLYNLYVFMNRQLLEANIRKDNKPLFNVKNLLCELREVWVEIAKKKYFSTSEPAPGGINIAG